MTDAQHETTGRGGLAVLLVADPGLPTRRAESIRDELEQLLDEVYGAPVELTTHTATLRLRPDDTLDFTETDTYAERFDDPDVVVMLTELPRMWEGCPLIAEIFPEREVAVISCPTLGMFASRRNILAAVMQCLLTMRTGRQVRAADRFARRWARWSAVDDVAGHVALTSKRVTGGARTVWGMVAGNEPLRTAPRLSSALAAAAATGAFGIFYSSIWAMSTYLSTPRLLGIGVAAIVTMTAWLIISNGLWDEPKHQGLAQVVLLYNLSTVLTLLMIVLLLYLALVVLIVVGAATVIAPDYMAQVIGRDPTVGTYLGIAWLSAAMGVVAGALGSSFDRSTDLRRMTHGQRERQRMYTESSSSD